MLKDAEAPKATANKNGFGSTSSVRAVAIAMGTMIAAAPLLETNSVVTMVSR